MQIHIGKRYGNSEGFIGPEGEGKPLMKYKALSVVYPAGQKIASGQKTIEVRSWMPPKYFSGDLLIVENHRFLRMPGETDTHGHAVALVRIRKVREYTEEDVNPATASRWDSGYYSWELEDVRPIRSDIPVLAARDIYEADLGEFIFIEKEKVMRSLSPEGRKGDSSKVYALDKVCVDDYEFLKTVHHVTLKPHVEKIWGWDELVQDSYFKNGFHPDHIQIIFYEGIPIGYLELTQEESIVTIANILILPRFQGFGIGSKIINDLIERNIASGLITKLGVFKINTRAKKLYESLGFQIQSETETHFVMIYGGINDSLTV
ncbi:MAG: hypothetical protein CL676_03460 [Bdellovibrionaceae bacterium]|nr:hypothetical protein [Pseudobdellovibrionaceae bacterium]